MEKRHTGWWNAGHGVWQRYYAGQLITVRKRGTGHYVAQVGANGIPAGTLASAKGKADAWARDNL